MKTIVIKDKDSGLRLDRWLRQEFDMPQGLVQKYLRKGLIRIEGKKVEASARLAEGQTVTLKLLAEKRDAEVEQTQTERISSKLTPQKIKETQSWVMVDTPRFIVINKPAGIPVQGGSGVKDSIDARLFALTKNGERPRLVHRLDRDTSGCLLLARTRKDAAALTKLFATRHVEKFYWALVVGVPQPYTGIIDAPLSKEMSGDEKEKMHISDEGKHARTEYKLIEKLSTSMSLIEMKPHTGRTHQLRAHIASIGCPIVGDGKYGDEKAYVIGEGISQKLHLHARRLLIKESGYKLDITAPLPKHMKETFESLGIDV